MDSRSPSNDETDEAPRVLRERYRTTIANTVAAFRRLSSQLAVIAGAPEVVQALRRELTMRAKPQERIDWEARRVVRTPAELQDDCAIAVLRWEPARIDESLVVEEQVVS